MKAIQVLDALEQYAPLPLQDGFDNAGLQIGLTAEQEVTGALLCLDVTEAVIAEAEREGCNLIVAHHPLLFHGLKSITGNESLCNLPLTGICLIQVFSLFHLNNFHILVNLNSKVCCVC